MTERTNRGLGPVLGCMLAGVALAGEARAQTHLVEKGVKLAWDSRHESLAPADLRVVDTVVRNGRVFTLYQQPLPAAGDPRDSVLVEASDASSGALLWRTGFRSNPSFPEVPLEIAAAPDGSAVFVASDILVTQGISTITHVALNRFEGVDGQRTLLELFTGKFGNGAGTRSLAVDAGGDRVFLATASLAGSRLASYDAFTGGVDWTLSLFSGIQAVLARPGVVFLIGSAAVGDNHLSAIDPASGGELWSVTHPTGIQGLIDASSDGSLVVTGRKSSFFFPSGPGIQTLVAWDGATGALRWSRAVDLEQLVVAQDGNQVIHTSSVSLFERSLEARFADTGDLHWSRTLNFGLGTVSVDLAVDSSSRLLGVLLEAAGSGGDEDTYLECYDSSNSQRLWLRNLSLDEDRDLEVDGSVPGFVVTGTEREPQTDGSLPLVASQFGFSSTGFGSWSRSTSTTSTTTEVADSLALSQDGSEIYTIGRSQPTSAGGPSIVQLVANDAESGAELWSVDQAVSAFPTDQSVAVSRSGILSGNGAFVYTRSLVGGTERLSALRSTDGFTFWSEELPGSVAGSALGGTSHLLVDRSGDRAFVVYHRKHSGISPHPMASIAAFDGNNLTPLWDANLDLGPLEDVPHHAALSADGSRIYVAGRLGASPITGAFVHCVDAASGAPVWSHQSALPGMFGERVAVSADGSTVILVENGGSPLLPKRHRVRALDAATGSTVWISAIAKNVSIRDLEISDATRQVLVTGSRFSTVGGFEQRDFTTIAYDFATGSRQWESRLDAGFDDDSTDLALSDDGITAFVIGASSPVAFPALVSQVETNTVALDLDTGEELWRAELQSLTTDVVVPVGLEYDAARSRLFVSGYDRDQDIATFSYEVPDLVVDRETLSLAQGGTVGLALRPGLGREADPYYLLGSATGTSPGIDFGGGLMLPLEPDAYFFVTLAAKASALSGFQGSFDARGIAAASLTIPAGSDPALAGLSLYHAFLAADVLGFPNGASNAVEVVLTP